jgi:YidC/Oxa1 family membrane protein insertase
LNFLYDNFISDFFLKVFYFLGDIFNDYALAIIILTIAIRFAMVPLDIQQKKSSRAMAKIQPQIKELQKRYANNQQMMQKKQKELQARENVKPMAGCLPMLIQLPIFFAFFGSLRVLSSDQTISLLMDAINNGVGSAEIPGWLWVNNLWQPDSGLSSILPSLKDFQSFIGQNINSITPQSMSLLQSEGILNFSATGIEITSKYETIVAQIIAASGKTGYNNGWFILPVLAGVSLFLQQHINSKVNPAMAEQQGGKMMLYFFPIFSIYICVISSAAFAIYWVTANIYALGSVLITNYIFKKREEKLASGVIVR